MDRNMAAVCAADTRATPGGEVTFSVWTREHADEALASALGGLGFHQIHREAGMVFMPGAASPPSSPSDLAIRPVVDDAGRNEYGRLMASAFSVYGTPAESTAEHFAALASVHGPATQAYLAYRGDR